MMDAQIAAAADGWTIMLAHGGTTQYRWKNTDIVDVEYAQGTREFNLVAGNIEWQKVRAFRLSVPRDNDDGVTLNEARTAMLRIAERVDNGAVPLEQHVECVKDYLDQAVAGAVLNSENTDKMRAENNCMRQFVESAMRARMDDAARIEASANFEARVTIAIARGHLPVTFMTDLTVWAK